ncbi:extracellular calcium-sensing receptor-like [Pleurodeles waltl]|uniref:extracellular calcium-sensing receptor-like n=1 Tax=Pleurodeles waltl TaxID=8319 RepID=UPI003709549D
MLCVRLSSLVLVSVCSRVEARVEATCRLSSEEVRGYAKEGDILIGGIFAVHLPDFTPISFVTKPSWVGRKTFSLQSYQWLQAMVFAVEEINRSPTLLPNVTLGFRIHDSCMMMKPVLEGTFWMLSERKLPIPNYRCLDKKPLAGIVGDTISLHSVQMARVLGLYRYPQISYFSTSPLLSDRQHFPSFFRTIPSDDFQAQGLGQLVIHFGWTWVGILATDNDYGQHGVQILQQELVKAGACIAFTEYIRNIYAEKNAQLLAKAIRGSSANAIIFFSSDILLIPLMDELVGENMTRRIWIASEAWSTSPLLSVEKYSSILSGSIGFAIHSGDIPGFKEHFTSIHPSVSPEDIFMKEFWENNFNCKWQEETPPQISWNYSTKYCLENDQLDISKTFYSDLVVPRVTYNVYSALLHYVRNVRSRKEAGSELTFDAGGNPQTQYDIVNWQPGIDGTLKQVIVGRYKGNAPARNRFILNISTILWNTQERQVPPSVCSRACQLGYRKAAIKRKPICCFLCVPCPAGEISNATNSAECSKCPWNERPNTKQDRCIPKTVEFLSYVEPLGTTLTAVSNLGSLMPVAVLGIYIHYRKTPVVKASNRNLSYLLLLSLTLCFLCSLIFIGYPTPEKCLIRQMAFGIIFAVCVSCILAKTIMVVIAFNATKPNSNLRRWAGPKLSYVVISVGTLLQVLLCGVWLLFSPPFPDQDIHTQIGKIIVQCNEGSSVAFWCMLAYLGLLATISFILAFLARTLPDCFNEAKFITFSMLAFLSVWTSFIPAYLSTRGKYIVAMEVFAIISSSSALITCIFFPKCYIILLRPEMNSKKKYIVKGIG